jgi:hypothetical protein
MKVRTAILLMDATLSEHRRTSFSNSVLVCKLSDAAGFRVRHKVRITLALFTNKKTQAKIK